MYPIIINDAKIPIYAWTDIENIEESAMQQATNAANHPFAFHHVALMPDVHTGEGICIGGVVALEGVVSCSMVGVDIGCGMGVIKTSLNINDVNIKILQDIRADIVAQIPVGFKHRNTPLKNKMPVIDRAVFEQSAVIKAEWDSAAYQLGTLGGGNHFWSALQDNNGTIYIMLHSGSRNIGNKVATYYEKLAKQLNEDWSWDLKLPSTWKLNFLPLYGKNKKYGEAYMREMQWCLDFAQANRKIMMDISCEVFHKHTNCKFSEPINIHHNYAAWENHFGNNVVVHRKGATSAKLGQLGIIPGSQGTKSYIVKGLGNPESFMSCSHGAGRVMSRTAAKEKLDLVMEQKHLNDLGILHGLVSKDKLEEADSVYKDIEQVIANQANLVEVVTELIPNNLPVVKE